MALSANPDKKIETELDDIICVVEESSVIDTITTKQMFWNMFIVDSIIGNTDRHNENWGFILDSNAKEISFAPIYDCGSCLNPMLEDIEMEKLTEVEVKNIAINCYSCLKENGKKINYMTYIKSMKNNECNEAIKRVFNNINIDKINDFIDEISCMSNTRKAFYKSVIKMRYDIVKGVYSKLVN